MDVREKSSNEKRLIDVNDIYSQFNQSGFARLHVADIDTIPRVDAVEVVRKPVVGYEGYYNEAFACSRLRVGLC